MKLSLSWIFDHINADWRQLSVPDLHALLIQKVTEIDSFYPVNLFENSFIPARVIHISTESIKLTLHSKTITLAARPAVKVGDEYIIYYNGSSYEWAGMHHMGSTKDHLLPAFSSRLSNNAPIAWDDYIIEIDNKAITHRPDLWSHRGFAQEIAALLQLPLKPLQPLLSDALVLDNNQQKRTNIPFTLERTTEHCKAIAASYIEQATIQPSTLDMIVRLCKVDTRPINFYVDTTNIVMADLGHPMHAFNADTIHNKKVIVRMARPSEKITILDGQTIELSSDDIIISDDTKPLSLVGIMGGKESGIQETTKNILIEAAQCNGTTIRLSAARHKKRTEASTRFEKELDPAGTIKAVQRFLKIVMDYGLLSTTPVILFDGSLLAQKTVTLTHTIIEQSLGVALSPDFIQKTLTTIGFNVTVDNGQYTIQIPSYRATKDIQIPADIIEEIGRFFGYQNIPLQAPLIPAHYTNLSSTAKERALKNTLAFGMRLHELKSYAFLDEAFVQQLSWNPQSSIYVESPVSQNWSRLNPTLMPHLFKAVQENHIEHPECGFFTIDRTWHTHNGSIIEQKKLAFIWYDQHAITDFYTGKNYVDQLLMMSGITPEWRQITTLDHDFYTPYKSAYIYWQERIIGLAGMVLPSMHTKIVPAHPASTLFIAELDMASLLERSESTQLQLPSKYPSVIRDISIIIPITVTTHTVVSSLKKVHPFIAHVEQIDFFQKKEWTDQRAIAVRITLCDPQATLTKQLVDAIMQQATDALVQLGATIR